MRITQNYWRYNEYNTKFEEEIEEKRNLQTEEFFNRLLDSWLLWYMKIYIKSNYMTIKDLIDKLKQYDEDRIVVISHGDSGWSNIESVFAIKPEEDYCVYILEEEYYGDN